MKRHISFLLLMFLCNLPSLSLAGRNVPELSTGILYPTPSDAITLNPSGLSGGQSKNLDLATLLGSGDVNLIGSFARTNSSLGFGLGAMKMGELVTGFGGVGFGMGKLSLGAGISSMISGKAGSSSPTFDLGLKYGNRSGMSLGAVVYNVSSSARSYSIGLGAGGQNIYGEFDVSFSSGLFNITTGSFGLAFNPTNEFTFLIANSFQIAPTFNFALDSLELGFNYWFSRSFALYALMNSTVSKYVVGIKLGF